MSQSRDHDPKPLVDALTAVRDAVERCRPLLSGLDSDMVGSALDTATATCEITVMLLQESLPPADDEEPGTGEALERAGDLAADARRHLVTGLHLIAGACAITTNVAGRR